MRKTALLALALPLLLLPSADAGTRYVSSVGVSPTGAYGSLATARASSDSLQYIGCYTFGYAGSTGVTSGVFCFARNSAGTTVGCHSYDDSIIRAVGTITPFSYVSFSMPSTGGICSSVFVDNFSYWGPLQP